MSDFDTDKNAQYAGDKAKNKLDELSGLRSSSLVNSLTPLNTR